MPSAPETSKPMIRIHALSHLGEVRTRNEDAIAIPLADDLIFSWSGEMPLEECWALLADGMGGHIAGEVASELALTVLRPLMPTIRDEDDITRAISDADAALYLAMEMRPELQGMGTTLAGAVFVGHEAIVFNVGDSRAYGFADGRLSQLSVDDAIEGQLTQCLGGSQDQVPLSPHIVRYPFRPGTLLLLCSDGLTDMVSDAKIAEILSARPANAATRLVLAALQAGGFDNVSVVALGLVDHGESAARFGTE